MIRQSGAQSYEQVIQFCRNVNIPLGRMLRLDLMRVIQRNETTNNTDGSANMPEASM
jgi:hypothetical protein